MIRVLAYRAVASVMVEAAQLSAVISPTLAIPAYRLIASWFSDVRDIQIKRLTAQSLVDLGLALGRLGRTKESMIVSDRIATLFSDEVDPVVRLTFAWGLVNKGAWLLQDRRNREAVALYKPLLKQLAKSPGVAEPRAQGLINLSIALARLGRSSEALTTRAAGVKLQQGLAQATKRSNLDVWSRRLVPVSVAAVSCSLAYVIDYQVGRSPLDHAKWLVAPVLYTTHVEHSRAVVVTGAVDHPLFLAVTLAIFGTLAWYAVESHWLIRVGSGMAIGGALANAIQLAFTGSVTDFIGVRTNGILSVGDVLIDTGFILIAGVAAAVQEREVSRTLVISLVVLGSVWALIWRDTAGIEFASIMWLAVVLGWNWSKLTHLYRARSLGQPVSM